MSWLVMSCVLTEALVMSRFAMSWVVLLAALVISVVLGSGFRTTWVSPKSVLSVTLTVTLALSDPVAAFTHTVRAVNDRGGTFTVTCGVEGTPAASAKPAVTPGGWTTFSWKER